MYFTFNWLCYLQICRMNVTSEPKSAKRLVYLHNTSTGSILNWLV